jgi:outer membrane biogenesis lipoprotein LolB
VTGRLRRIALLIAPVVLLAGCALAPQAPPIRSVDAVERFGLTGRVAVKLESKGYSARLRWLHEPQDDALWLYSPVGSVLATLTVDGHGATLVTAEREVFRSSDVQALTLEVLGRPDPGVPVIEVQRDDRSRLLRLVQRDWTIEYSGYVDDGVLPAGLTLHYGDLRLRLVIDRWQIAGT